VIQVVPLSLSHFGKLAMRVRPFESAFVCPLSDEAFGALTRRTAF